MTISTKETRLSALDILRAIAAISVVFFHLSAPVQDKDSFYRIVVSYGFLGVPVFFVISGYCIWMIVSRAKSPFEFITKRFLRIYLPYWFSLFIVICCILTYRIIYGVNDLTILPKDINSVMATLSIMTSPATSISTINWVYWSLTYEIIFYIVIFFILFSKHRIALLFIFSVLSAIPEIAHLKGLFFLKYFNIFLSGVGLYGLLADQPNKKGYYAILLFSSFGTFYQLGILTWVVSGLTLLVIFLSQNFNFAFNLRLHNFSKIGQWSYSLYLLHVPVGIYLLKGFQLKIFGIPDTNAGVNFLFDSLIVFLLIILSRFSFTYIENPSIQLAKTLWRRIEK